MDSDTRFGYPGRKDTCCFPIISLSVRSQLLSLLHKLHCSPSLFTEYDTIIQEQLKWGMIEPIPSSQPPTGAKVYYMPHHAVIHKDKSTTKIRVMFDASAKALDSVSLNDCLYSGPKYKYFGHFTSI